MVVVTLDEARERLAELVEAAARGETVTIVRDGTPVARLERAWDQSRVDEAIENVRRLGVEMSQWRQAQGQPPVTIDDILAWRDEGRP